MGRHVTRWWCKEQVTDWCFQEKLSFPLKKKKNSKTVLPIIWSSEHYFLSHPIHTWNEKKRKRGGRESLGVVSSFCHTLPALLRKSTQQSYSILIRRRSFIDGYTRKTSLRLSPSHSRWYIMFFNSRRYSFLIQVYVTHIRRDKLINAGEGEILFFLHSLLLLFIHSFSNHLMKDNTSRHLFPLIRLFPHFSPHLNLFSTFAAPHSIRFLSRDEVMKGEEECSKSYLGTESLECIRL